ncbi:CNP1-like family protein [Variovorax sp. J22R133]|uniref:CNP1-like family protein n=1 Tax=Variovorax brevis TaxID=3053503 RepID=UPI002574EC5E|nr:CNP1-like family protein [Variovorax sp. J22R133]MDM0112964.1 CNP1-like family protein [Variovorax sp. J22R133]
MSVHKTARLRQATFTRRASCALALLLPVVFGLAAPIAAHAQLLFQDLDWKESDVPPPPAFDPKRMVEIDMSRRMELKYGVDPATIVITKDGVVRYVVMASRSGEGGAFNAFYEGLRCATGEAKTYARYSGGEWHMADKPEWQRLNAMGSRHTLALARQGICSSAAPRQSVQEMVQSLRNPTPSN